MLAGICNYPVLPDWADCERFCQFFPGYETESVTKQLITGIYTSNTFSQIPNFGSTTRNRGSGASISTYRYFYINLHAHSRRFQLCHSVIQDFSGISKEKKIVWILMQVFSGRFLSEAFLSDGPFRCWEYSCEKGQIIFERDIKQFYHNISEEQNMT